MFRPERGVSRRQWLGAVGLGAGLSLLAAGCGAIGGSSEPPVNQAVGDRKRKQLEDMQKKAAAKGRPSPKR